MSEWRGSRPLTLVSCLQLRSLKHPPSGVCDVMTAAFSLAQGHQPPCPEYPGDHMKNWTWVGKSMGHVDECIESFHALARKFPSSSEV